MNDDPKFSLIIQKIEKLGEKIQPKYPNWLSVRQCAKYLQLSESTIRKLVALGKVPYRRLPLAEGGKLLFNRRQIDLWLLSGEIRPKTRARQTFEALLD